MWNTWDAWETWDMWDMWDTWEMWGVWESWETTVTWRGHRRRGGPKGGAPQVRQDGGHHRWPGPGGILWICLTLVRGVPEATGVRTAALAKTCKERSEGRLHRNRTHTEEGPPPRVELHLDKPEGGQRRRGAVAAVRVHLESACSASTRKHSPMQMGS